MFESLGFTLCLIHTPPLMTLLVHPSWRQLLTGAPWLIHIPPFGAILKHPSWLLTCHNLLHTVCHACYIYNRPSIVLLLHSSLLQFLVGTPCFIHTASFWPRLWHPLWLYILYNLLYTTVRLGSTKVIFFAWLSHQKYGADVASNRPAG